MDLVLEAPAVRTELRAQVLRTPTIVATVLRIDAPLTATPTPTTIRSRNVR